MYYEHVTTAGVAEAELLGEHTTPFAPPLQQLIDKIKEVYPLCSVSRRHRGPSGRLANPEGSESCYVYHKHKPMVMGWVGYGNYRKAGGEDSFVVSSRRVRNHKYSEDTDHFFMTMSKNLDVAERQAKKYLRDYGPLELAPIEERKARDNWGASDGLLRDRFRSARQVVCHDGSERGKMTANVDVLLAELQVLVSTGYKFVNPEFGAQVEELLSVRREKTEQEQERSARVSMVSVESSPTTGDTLFAVAHTENISRWVVEWEAKGTFVEDTLDPDIRGKLAVLQMCEVKHWVDGVGFKVTDTMFYVVQ